MLYMYVTPYILRLWSYGIWYCCLVYGYHHSAVTYYIPYLVHLNPEDGGHIIFQNAGILPPDCKMSHFWRYAVLVFTTVKNPKSQTSDSCLSLRHVQICYHCHMKWNTVYHQMHWEDDHVLTKAHITGTTDCGLFAIYSSTRWEGEEKIHKILCITSRGTQRCLGWLMAKPDSNSVYRIRRKEDGMNCGNVSEWNMRHVT
jgi:hypothetical protein